MSQFTFVTSTSVQRIIPTSPNKLEFKQPLLRPRRSHIVAHLRRRVQTPPVPNSGRGSKDQIIESIRYPSLKLFTRVWEPVREAQAGMLIIPSIMWHSGWFWEVSTALAEEGVRVIAVDSIGTGRSDSIDGIPLYIKCMDDLIDDFEAIIYRLKESLPDNAPISVLAESAGAVPQCILATRPNLAKDVAGWILCGPAIKVNEKILPPQFLVSILRAVTKVFPKVPLLGDDFDGDTFDEAFGDGRSAEIAKKDPYIPYKKVRRTRTAITMFDGMALIEDLLSKNQLYMNKVLILHNKADVRTVYEASENFVRRVQNRDGAELIDLGGKHHQLFQEEASVTKAAIRKIVDFVQELDEHES